MIDWLKHWASWLAGFSTLLVVAGFLAAFIFVITMPADHFIRPASEAEVDGRHAAVRFLRRALKNALGIVVLVIGVLMALPLVPGPGLLLIVIGVSLADFPCKHALELWVLRRRFIIRPVNRLRTACGRLPLQLPHPIPRA